MQRGAVGMAENTLSKKMTLRGKRCRPGRRSDTQLIDSTGIFQKQQHWRDFCFTE